jgi:hypothetical protein
MASVKYYKGTQEEFDKIIDKKNFTEVEKIYIDNNGGLYFVLKDKKKKLIWWRKKGD